MVVGIGIGTEMALNGAAAHAFAHIIYKALLLMSAGSVLYMTGKRKCTDLGGLFRTMPLTTFCGIVGALSISVLPADLGFRFKIDDFGGRRTQHLARLVPAHRRIGRRVPARRHQVPVVRVFPQGLGSEACRSALEHARRDGPLACICMASACSRPALRNAAVHRRVRALYGQPRRLQLQLLLFSGLAFFLLLGWLKRTLTITLDVDWFYRRLGRNLGRGIDDVTGRAWQRLVGAVFFGRQARQRTASSPPQPGRCVGADVADRHHGLLDDGDARCLPHLGEPMNIERLRELIENLVYPELVTYGRRDRARLLKSRRKNHSIS